MRPKNQRKTVLITGRVSATFGGQQAVLTPEAPQRELFHKRVAENAGAEEGTPGHFFAAADVIEHYAELTVEQRREIKLRLAEMAADKS
jgi:hypothetical protein